MKSSVENGKNTHPKNTCLRIRKNILKNTKVILIYSDNNYNKESNVLSIFTKKETSSAKESSTQDYLDFIQLKVSNKEYERLGGGSMGYVDKYLEIKTKNKSYSFYIFEKSKSVSIHHTDGGVATLKLTEPQQAQLEGILKVFQNHLEEKAALFKSIKESYERDLITLASTSGLV